VNRLLGRYLLAEILFPLIAWVSFLFLLLFVMAFLRGSNVLLGSGVSARDLAMVSFYLAPHFLQQALPIAFLLAILLGIGRLSEDMELVAMQSLGMGPRQILVGPITLGAAIGVLMLAMSWSLEPWGMTSVKHAANEIIKKNLVGDVKPGVFYDDLSDLTLYAEAVDKDTRSWTHVLIHDDRDKSSPLLVVARSGRVNPQGQGEALKVALVDGEVHRGDQAAAHYTLAEFERGEIVVGVGENFYYQNRFRSPREELTPPELLEAARDAESRGENGRPFVMAYHWRWGQALMPVAFAVFGTPLAMSRRRSGRARGYVLTIFGYISYYVVARVCVNLGDKGNLAPVLAAVLPNVLFTALGVFALYRVMRSGTVRP
jgi:lipopolysaccharide export system permease protein